MMSPSLGAWAKGGIAKKVLCAQTRQRFTAIPETRIVRMHDGRCVPLVDANTTVRIVETWPAGDDVTLRRNQIFYLQTGDGVDEIRVAAGDRRPGQTPVVATWIGHVTAGNGGSGSVFGGFMLAMLALGRWDLLLRDGAYGGGAVVGDGPRWSRPR